MLQYEIRGFSGVCPKTRENKILNVLYQPTYTLRNGNCLHRFKPECRCDIDCPIYKQAPEYLPSNG